MISPVTVRRTKEGKYELVAGERRVRAARLANMNEIPVVIKELTDENVIEIQLAENIQRENPHPMHEAEAIGQMQKMHKTIDEIAARIGKSKQFVYGRIKLLSLTENFREMFLRNAINLQEAVEIATLTATSQDELYESECADWKEQKNFSLDRLDYLLRMYKYDLSEAPFDTKDKNLIAEKGACTKCPSNTATLKSLFPEFAKQAICSNKECYQQKCHVNFVKEFTKMLAEEKPEAIICYGEPSASIQKTITSIPGAAALPVIEYYALNTIDAPEKPDAEDYEDEEEYKDAIKEYEEEMDGYQTQVVSGKCKKGILISRNEIHVILYNTDRSQREIGNPIKQVTAKEVQQAIKEGKVTKDLLQNEIERINYRDRRAEQIDKDKIQTELHTTFYNETNENTPKELTDADNAAARFVVYQSLDYSTRSQVDRILFDLLDNIMESEQGRYMQLAQITDVQYAYLIRMAVLGKSECKNPNTEAGKCLYEIAKQAGCNVAAIEQAQQKIAEKRKERKDEKIASLEKKMERL
jgi:ParB family chromosome partitioning protein